MKGKPQLVRSMFPAIDVLACCPDTEYRNRHGQLMFHPLAVYNISRAKCLRRFRRVTEELENRKTRDEYVNNAESLLEAYEALLHALADHWDDCISIVRSIFSDNSKVAEIEKQLRASLEHHFEARVRLPINQIKHHTHRIATVVYCDAEFVVPGFFFIAPVEKGVAGPSPLVHRNGMHEYSFSLALRKLFLGLHQVSAALKAVILEGLPPNMPIAIPSSSEEGDNNVLVQLGTWFSSSQRCRFPGEHAESMPDIKCDGMCFEFQAKGLKRVIDCRSRSMQVSMTYTGDGVTRSFKIPGAG